MADGKGHDDSLSLSLDFSLFPAPASPPRNLEAIPVSSTELQVTWDSPPFAHWNSEKLRYKIGYK